MLPLFDDHRGIGVVMCNARRLRFDLLEVAGMSPGRRDIRNEMIAALRLDAATYVSHFVTPRPLMMVNDIQSPPLPENVALLASLGAEDMLGLVTEPEPGSGLVLWVTMRKRRSTRRGERAKLTRIALHLEASMRAQMRPDSVLGTVSPTGRLDLATDALDPKAREEVTSHVNGVERARLRANRSDGDGALKAWHALTAGHVSLLERVEPGGKRLYEICETAPRHQHLRALSQLEVNVLADAARGLRNKEVAYALGISQVRVSQALAGAVAKLGMRSARDAVHLAAGLRGATGSLQGLDRLTPSEREVAELASSGLTNREIAARRSTSVRTVANQLASILDEPMATWTQSRPHLQSLEFGPHDPLFVHFAPASDAEPPELLPDPLQLVTFVWSKHFPWRSDGAHDVTSVPFPQEPAVE